MNNLRNVFFAIGEFIFYLYCDNRKNKVFCLDIGAPMTEDELNEYHFGTACGTLHLYSCIYDEYE